jgi:hypothetical protein
VTALTWDRVGERLFQTGVSHGVLYLHDGRSAVWNGLSSVEDDSAQENKSYFLDGVKYLEQITPGDFSGKLKAFTYPSEFEDLLGIETVSPGLTYYDQPPKSFNLSYQTKLGNDLEGSDYGYKIHILYNLVANSDPFLFETLKETLAPTEFTWGISGTPPKVLGYRPTVHVAIDSTTTPPDVLSAIEDIIYGTADTHPRLPPIDELSNLFKALGVLVIVDNGDGTWTAIDQANDYISMTNSTTFQIDNADATYLDVTTYTITTTYPDDE